MATPLAKKNGVPRIFDVVVWKVSAWKRWSCRLSPTGRSATTSMPWSRRCWAWPMPESISSWAEPTNPAERMTSLPARMVRFAPSPFLLMSVTSMPTARPFSRTILVVSVSVWSSRPPGLR